MSPPKPHDLTLSEFLGRYPWPEEWAKRGPTRNFLFSYDLETTPEKIWPYLADVSAFNKLLGLSEMKFTEKEGKSYGTSKTPAGMLAWEELPWEWDYGHSIAHARLYNQGYFKVFRARYIAERHPPQGLGGQDQGENRMRLYVYFGVVPANLWGQLTARIFFKGLEERYRKAFEILIPYIQKQQKLISASRPVVFSPEIQKRMENARENLVKEGISTVLAKKIVDFLQSAPEEDLVRIRIKPLAREWNAREKELLEAFLRATRQGLFNLTWDVICPHCRGVRQEVGTLGQIPKRGNCAVCKIDFDATAFNALEVTFHAHPSIRKVEKRVYCSAEPATKPHIKVQKTIKAKEELPLPTLLGLGRYRLRVHGQEVYNLLDVDAQSGETRFQWADYLAQKNFKTGHFPTMILQNTSGGDKTFILEENMIDRDTLRPVDLFSFQGFRDLFSEEALAADLKLEVGVQTILFTDLVGSTKFYEIEGDTVAFAEVRSHFLKAYDFVRKNDGAVVKTIGDAVMAAFAHPLDAIKAAVEMQGYFNGQNPETRLRLRVTLNRGSCLAVNLNSNIDYFGNTVNLSAKIQAIAGAGQVGFTEGILDDPEAQAYLQEKGLKPEKVDFEMKWAKKTIPVYRVEVK
ncbi:MAG TPA: DUF5939 domain-containing protein [bacterium]|nr:DUF5939 domain-containing protein [bacterium]